VSEGSGRSLAVETCALTRCFGERRALDSVDLAIEPAEIFGLLGPNGGGKSTLFRILSTLLRPTTGSASVFGYDVVGKQHAVRGEIGVVFQNPSLDIRLSVIENLRYQGAMYGLSGTELESRSNDLLDKLGLRDRRADLVGKLSGGLARRVEIAKGMLHRPRLLLLDEPSTGLDPGARIDLGRTLFDLSRAEGVTVLMTTHILEEADGCDRVAILNAGKLIACGSPEALKRELSAGVLTIEAKQPEELSQDLASTLSIDAKLVDGTIRVEDDDAAGLVEKIFAGFGDRIDSVTVGKPSLEDVFLARTGQRFDAEGTQ